MKTVSVKPNKTMVGRQSGKTQINFEVFWTKIIIGKLKDKEKEIKQLRELILQSPADVKLLKREYYQLTGKRFKRRKGE